jgi:ribose-phosphate pyrophosphokinase
MSPVVFNLGAEPGLADRLCDLLGLAAGTLERRRFPDGESYVRLATPVSGRDVVLICPLDRPDEKTLSLIFAADAARRQGARSVGLVAPYLAYMRQDKAFRPGEAVTSRSFARLLSRTFDWLVTVDPHLHRYAGLDELYSVPAFAATAAEPIAQWIAANVDRPMLIGPDEESAQWVEAVSRIAGAPWAVLRKERRGDLDVTIGAGVPVPPGRTPVIVDDIASSAHTMIEAVRKLRAEGRPAPFCLVVHAIFAGDAYERLVAAQPAAIVSTNCVEHRTNAIDVARQLAAVVDRVLSAGAAR